MIYKFDKNAHSVYTLNYHLVQCIKYRRKVLSFPEIIDELKTRTHKIAESYGIKITAIESDLDHIHILFIAKPQTDLLKFVNNWKSATSKALRNKFKDKLKDKLWGDTFWSGSYCLITSGQVTLDILKKYVESQGEPKNVIK
ncbi:MAG: IS200/IS605 family transposase [Candidatus Woesearchaeota archaeon]|jgi:putative transposase